MILSQSEIKCFQRCPREHHYRYRERVEPLLPAKALVRGKSAHQALATWWQHERLDLDGLEPADRAMMLAYAAFYGRPSDIYWNIRTSVPFRVRVWDVDIVGELDVLATDKRTGDTVIVEHKTTGDKITPGSWYWRGVQHTSLQASVYLRAYPEATILWDALKKPALRERANDTPKEFEERCLSHISEKATEYFRRATVVRLESEHTSLLEDVLEIAGQMRSGHRPRNPDSCYSYFRECDFFPVCWEGAELSGSRFQLAERNHTEVVAVAEQAAAAEDERNKWD
jgi:PD-(D/E)XK nuclease superfamily